MLRKLTLILAVCLMTSCGFIGRLQTERPVTPSVEEQCAERAFREPEALPRPATKQEAPYVTGLWGIMYENLAIRYEVLLECVRRHDEEQHPSEGE